MSRACSTVANLLLLTRRGRRRFSSKYVSKAETTLLVNIPNVAFAVDVAFNSAS